MKKTITIGKAVKQFVTEAEALDMDVSTPHKIENLLYDVLESVDSAYTDMVTPAGYSFTAAHYLQGVEILREHRNAIA